MSILLGILTLGTALYGMAGCVASAKHAITEKELESRGDLDVIRDFDLILKLNGVGYSYEEYWDDDDKVLVLEENGYLECLKYIQQQPLTSDEDIKLFIEHYNKLRNEQIKKRQERFNESYNLSRRYFYQDLEKCNNPNIENYKIKTIVYRKEHWKLISGHEHMERISKLYFETFWGDIATQPAKLVFDFDLRCYIEIWHVKFYAKYPLDDYYSRCCKRLGFKD